MCNWKMKRRRKSGEGRQNREEICEDKRPKMNIKKDKHQEYHAYFYDI